MSRTKKINELKKQFNYRMIDCCSNCKYIGADSHEDFYCEMMDDTRVYPEMCCDKWE